MAVGTSRLLRSLQLYSHIPLRYCSTHAVSSSSSPIILQEAIIALVRARAYERIPDVLTSFKQACQNPNHFSFLSSFPQSLRKQVIDEILQSFIPLRPRSRPQITYACLLFYTLQSLDPFPIALAVLQQNLRSGCIPVPQTHLLLSSAWLQHRRSQSESVQKILLDMKLVGYQPDCGTCNYLISSLCGVDQLMEAVKVLKGMAGAGCVPDSESYDIVIKAMCKFRKNAEAIDMVKHMVEKVRLTPRQGTLVKLASALRANREMWRAVEVIKVLEREGHVVGFETYELVVEGCLECREYILAGKVAIGMAEKGFVPYIGVRQKLVERLAGVGEWKLACDMRQRFAELQS